MDSARETLPVCIRYGKWAGLVGAVMALIAHQQVASSWIYASCPPSPATLVYTTAAICGSLAIGSGAWSWWVRRSLRTDPATHLSTNTDRFIASLSAAFTLIVLLFIAFSAAAVLFLQCER